MPNIITKFVQHLLLISCPTFMFAQSVTKTIEINIKELGTNADGNYQYIIPLENNNTPEIELLSFEADTFHNQSIKNYIPNSFSPDVNVFTASKQHKAVLSIPQLAIINNVILKPQKITVQITEASNTTTNKRNRQIYVDNSVLATGTWYKIAVKERGIYKIDYNFLTTIGINPSNINPANIRIYGNGGQQMGEQVASDNNYDDLIENAIFVSTNGPSFGTNDYILFYADGPTTWKYNSSTNKFEHTTNIYEDYSYFFLNTDLGPGKRIGQEIAPPNTPTITINEFNNYYLYEYDSFSISELGRQWWSNRMATNNAASLTQNISTNLYHPNSSISYETVVAHKNTNSGTISLSINGTNVNSTNLYPVSSEAYQYYDDNKMTGIIPNSSSNLNFQYRYNSNSTGQAYIDYLLLNYNSNLIFNNTQLNFRNTSTLNLNNNQITKYEIQHNANLSIWDVSNPFLIKSIATTLENGKVTFLSEGNTLKEFIAFNGSYYHTPIFIEQVTNQNLHATQYNDLIIITPTIFLSAAEDFANYKRNKFGQSCAVITTDKIYNEFGSGSKDIGAIRNFIKMFYDRANDSTEIPKGVLLFGNASYDFKNRVNNNTNYIPGYQSKQSRSNSSAYMTDDFFAILDDGEDINNNNAMLDIAVGRWPINTIEEAYILIEKYKHYHSKDSYGPWKNDVTYVADDRDFNNGIPGMNHLDDCEAANNFFLNNTQEYNLYKIYADAYKVLITSAGARFPDVTKALNDKIRTGTLYLSYSGHGSPQRWAHESILSSAEYSKWNNINNLPFVFTGTCDFSRFDNPAIKAAGVDLLKRKEGGAIALISTTQIVYSTANTNLSTALTKNLFTKFDGHYKSIGDVIKLSKNQNINHFSNNLNYALLGDPTMKLQIPELDIKVDALKNISTGSEYITDTLQSLGKYKIEGHIADINGTLMSDFNGIIYISIFDKKINLLTLQDPKQPTPQFSVQNNILTKVTATVQNGKFTSEFIIPKDIIFDYGNSKLTMYAHSDNQEAKGAYSNLIVGGIDKNASANDYTGPIVKAYIDDEKFKDGSITGENPMLYATIDDDLGINVSGSSLGHDLVAILDNDEGNPIVMNSFYNSNLNDYTSGYVKYPFANLPEGKHSITVRAWDIHNNSGEGTVTFEVKNPNKGFIGEIYNYPNPFSSSTNIVIQHNQEGKKLNIKIKIFNTSGSLIGYTAMEHVANENRSIITWDGTTLSGKPLEAGLYFYNVSIETEDGITANKNEKLIYLTQ